MTSEAKRTNSMKKFLAALLLAAVWIACGHIARGYWIGHFTTMFPDQEQEEGAGMNYVAGPAALIDGALSGDFDYPYMQHGYTCQQRYDAFREAYEVLGKDKNYFVHNHGNQLCKAEDLR